MAKRFYPTLISLVLLLMQACSTAGEAMAPGPKNRPGLPGDVNVDGQLLRSGDLPAGYTIAAEYPQVPETRIFLKLHNIPKADRVYNRSPDQSGQREG